MNLLISDSWLGDFLKTKATAYEIGESLSLCSQSVERIKKVDHDFLYDIEITTNRPDCFSVYGLARELAAILPRFDFPAKFNAGEVAKIQEPEGKNALPLEVKIADPNLCPRFTALIFEISKLGPSPKIVRERLEKAGIRALNNVVDISNYLMIELGQPMHTFDYDKIKGTKMTLRSTQKEEKITTLDKQTRILPKETIIIEDGEERIIDLCGIMGAENSAVDEKTRRVLLFVQTYDPARIRRTCQLLGFRTEAASRFEKGVDPEGVPLAIGKAIKMFEKNCQAKIVSKLIDLYPEKQKVEKVQLDLALLTKIMGLEIPKKEITEILESLGFLLKIDNPSLITATVPHWRNQDISIPEDLIEEVARIYGYNRLPNTPLPVLVNNESQEKFFWEGSIKTALKHWGFTEITNYSLIDENSLKKVSLESSNYLKIANPLNEDLLYVRPSLLPSLLQIISQNQANFSAMRIFEIANIYLPQGENHLPDEIKMLTGLYTGHDFFTLKGLFENLLENLGIPDYQFTASLPKTSIFNPRKTAEILIKGKSIGLLGEIDKKILSSFSINSKLIGFDIELGALIKNATKMKKYKPLISFPSIVEDLSFVVKKKIEVAKMMEAIKNLDKLIVKVELLDSYQDTQTFRITYQSPVKTLSTEAVGKIRERIIKIVKEKFGAYLKQLPIS